MVHEGPRVIEDANNYEARANIMWGGMMAHNNSCCVGRSQDWLGIVLCFDLSKMKEVYYG